MEAQLAEMPPVLHKQLPETMVENLHACFPLKTANDFEVLETEVQDKEKYKQLVRRPISYFLLLRLTEYRDFHEARQQERCCVIFAVFFFMTAL